MKNKIKMMAFVALMVVFAVAPVRVQSHGLEVGDLVVSDVWARATMSRAKTGAAYLTIKNNGTDTDALIKVISKKSKKAAVHQSLMENGMMTMRPVKKLPIKPGDTVMLKPGGYHIMFMGLKAPFTKGQTFPVTLVFEKSGSVDVTVTVMKAGAHAMKHKHLPK